MSIRLLLADDHDIIRQSVKSFLSQQPDIAVIAEAKDGTIAVDLAEKLSPDIVLMDIKMSKMNGIEAARQMIGNNADTKIIILSTHSDKSFVEAAFKAGVLGYVLKSSIFDDLMPAIRHAMANDSFQSPKITDILGKNCMKELPDEDDSGLIT